jgi:coenzyme F420-reducing hydrogenase delta subunit
MVPHPNQRIGRTLAVVDPDLCAACGICAGACPTSTPFRRAEKTLVTGIDMPERPIAALRERLRQGLAALKARDAGSVPLVLFACERGAQPGGARAGGDVLRVDLLCAGQLPPSFIEYALRDGAGGVLVAACREGGCEFRHGESIAMQRLTGQREPHLRARAAQGDRVALVFAGAGDAQAIETTLERLRTAVARAPLVPEESPA